MQSEQLSGAVEKLNLAEDALRDARVSVEQLGGAGNADALPNVAGADPFVLHLAIFVLAVVVGAYAVRSVAPALHAPLASLTSAISSVIVVGALLAVDISASGASTTFGFAGLVLAAVGIVGGFLVTRRLLAANAPKNR